MRNSDRWAGLASIAFLCLFLQPAKISGLCRLTTDYVIEATVSRCKDVEDSTKQKFTLAHYLHERDMRFARLYVKESSPKLPADRLVEVGDMDAELKEFLDDNKGYIVDLFLGRSVGLLYQRDRVAPGAHVLRKESVGGDDLYLVKTAGIGAAAEVTAFAGLETGLCVSSSPATRLLRLEKPCCDLVPTGQAACLLDIWVVTEVSSETRKLLVGTEDWIGEEETDEEE